MPRAGLRTELIVFERFTTTANNYNEKVESWAEYARRRARVRFGTAQEKREAAKETASQTATFECVRSADLDAVTTKDRILYLADHWDITASEPLDRKTIRFTAVRSA